ncbi:MAG TPA: amidohydrolase family protein [Thermoanaerobaculia bacterium]|nr:amidohydrolase family protein [Thermoanaerobaculia bacterium]
MSRSQRTAVLALAALAGLLALPAAAGAETVAFVGATVHPVSGPPVAGATLVVEGDRIAAVGAGVAVPAGARVVDVAGKHLYPGFVHPLTNLGLVEVSSVRGSVDTTEIGQVNSNLRAEVAFNADSFRLPPALAGGVVAAHVVPRGGVLSGSSAVMRLQGWNWRDMTVAAPVGMHLWWPRYSRGGWWDRTTPEELEKRKREELEVLDETLERARAYGGALGAAARDPVLAPAPDPRLDALQPVLAGEVPLFVHAATLAQIEDALDWLDEQGFDRAVLVAGYDVARAAERVAAAGVPVILDTVHRVPTRDWEPYDAAFTAAARLHQAGVRFAIASGGAGADSENARNLPFEAATAAAFGLPREAALEAITLRAAEILGVADRLGSLEPGKEASFFVADGDPLEILTTIESVWVAGREVDRSADRQWRLYRKYDARPRPTAR